MALALAVFGAAPAGGTTLLGLIDTGELYASSDGGLSWTGLSTLPVRDAIGLQARFEVSELYLASRSGVVYQSPNGGLTWSAVGAVAASDVEDLLVRSDGALMLLSRTGSVYLSTDKGSSFSAIATLTGSNFASLAQRTDGRLYALTRTGEVYESTDLGTIWVAKSAITVANAIRIRAMGQQLYVMTETGDFAASNDAAATWNVVGTLSQVGMQGLVRDGGSLIAASREGHVARSPDGKTWTWQGSMNQLRLTALATNEPATTGVGPQPVAGGVALGLPYPNPSSGAASFSLRLEQSEGVTLALYDPGGRRIASRGPEMFPAGSHTVTWNPNVRRVGLYFLRIETGSRSTLTRRWVVIGGSP